MASNPDSDGCSEYWLEDARAFDNDEFYTDEEFVFLFGRDGKYRREGYEGLNPADWRPVDFSLGDSS